MKLLIVSHSCATPENRQLYAVLRNRTNWDITLVVPKVWNDEFQNILAEKPWPSFDDATVYFPVIGNGNIILHAYVARWRKFLAGHQFDAIYMCHEPYAIATFQLWAANRLGSRLPFGFHSCQNINKTYPVPFRQMESLVCRSSDYAFPITPAVEAVLRDKGFAGEATLCPFPVDTGTYAPNASSRLPAAFRRTSGDPVTFGYVGRIVESKGFRTLAAALAKIRDLSWQFVIIGAGDFESEFDALAQTGGFADRVIKRGYISHSETPAHMAELDFLVLPSETQPNWKEQFGRVILESMACGTPVVGSDSGEIPNLINCSKGGLIFPERDADSLAAAMRLIITDVDLRAKFAERGRAWVVENVGIESISDAISTTIEAAVMRNRALSNGRRRPSELS
jgi:glycosyltransferase involved in cell wall biosynthesis